MDKILVVVPGIGDINFNIKEKIFIKNYTILNESLKNYKIEYQLFNYSNNNFSSKITSNKNISIHKEKGIIGEFLFKHITPNFILKNQYKYVFILLDDIEISIKTDYNNLLMIYNQLKFNIISPTLENNNNDVYHKMMLTKSKYKNKLLHTNFAELFFYILDSKSYKKYYDILDEQTYWMWGIDLILSKLDFKIGLVNDFIIKHHYTKSSYHPNLPDSRLEMELKIKKYGLFEGYIYFNKINLVTKNISFYKQLKIRIKIFKENKILSKNASRKL